MNECLNMEWAAENGESTEWARGMWHCPCAECDVPLGVAR